MDDDNLRNALIEMNRKLDLIIGQLDGMTQHRAHQDQRFADAALEASKLDVNDLLRIRADSFGSPFRNPRSSDEEGPQG